MNIDINNISKTFKDVKALDSVSTTFSTGKIYGLLGRNGAGKSTLMRVIGNRIFQDSGTISIGGIEINSDEKLFKNLFISNEDNMFPSDEKCINIFKLLRDIAGFDYDTMLSLSDEFSLNTKIKWEKLSTGYRTIFNDIIALASPASFVFYDEPILGLDANHRELFYEKLLASYSEDRCIVIATHIIEEISQLINSVIIINQGKIIVDSDKDELLEDLYLISGNKDDIERISNNAINIRKSLGQYIAIVKGFVDTPNINIEKLDLQRYFVEMTR